MSGEGSVAFQLVWLICCALYSLVHIYDDVAQNILSNLKR